MLPGAEPDIICIMFMQECDLRFAGYATDERIEKKRVRLEELLTGDGYQIISSYELALYNPPWTPPFMRRNEVMVAIQ